MNRREKAKYVTDDAKVRLNFPYGKNIFESHRICNIVGLEDSNMCTMMFLDIAGSTRVVIGTKRWGVQGWGGGGARGRGKCL